MEWLHNMQYEATNYWMTELFVTLYFETPDSP